MRTLAQTLLSTHAALQSVDLTHNSIGDDGVRALTAVLKPPGEAGGDGGSSTLKRLDLSWNGISTRGGRYLGDALKGTPTLVVLTLSWNGLMDRGARALGEALATNTKLTSLDVRAAARAARRPSRGAACSRGPLRPC